MEEVIASCSNLPSSFTMRSRAFITSAIRISAWVVLPTSPSARLKPPALLGLSGPEDLEKIPEL